MTVVAGAVVATVATAGLAAPVVTAPALSGMVAGSASAASAAAGTATATVAAGTAAGTAAGASTAGLTAGIASGPVGWLILGAEPHSSTQHPVAAAGATFDCWKPVVRDNSTQLSSGKLLKEMMTDERIKEIIIGECRNEFNLPELSLINIWDERFDINYLVLPFNNQLVAHAIRAA